MDGWMDKEIAARRILQWKRERAKVGHTASQWKQLSPTNSKCNIIKYTRDMEDYKSHYLLTNTLHQGGHIGYKSMTKIWWWIKNVKSNSLYINLVLFITECVISADLDALLGVRIK